jgi:hypothetical protein
MRKLINAIRDFIYTITDYGLIITVVVIMVAVLAWRFDILFNRDIEKEAIASIPGKNQTEEPVINNPSDDEENIDDPNSSNDDPDDSTETPTNQSDLIATVEIPAGSFPSKIGDILINSNLIADKNEFLNRSVELGLDTKLQSGTFEISVGTALDDIIKIIAKSY